MTRAAIVVLDSFGIGATDDAERFGDSGADTFGSIARRRAAAGTPLNLPNLARLGLVEAHRDATGREVSMAHGRIEPAGLYGYAAETSSGKDTPSGHWEMAGVPVLFDWGYFTAATETFPDALLDALIERGDLPGILGNCHASGTEIIARLGLEHMRSGKPIVYTSADSVFQIACHEGTFGLERLYALCEIARELVDEYNVGRVIARPFVGSSPDDFVRTSNRRDLTTPPHAPTLLDRLEKAGGTVIGIGKIADIFAHRGVTEVVKAAGNDALVDATVDALGRAPERSLVFTNLVDFDMLYGHRRNVDGYADALEAFDRRLPELEARLGDGDVLVLSADHGCDPTWPGSDHTREYVPVLVSGDVEARNIGRRTSFADIGQSLAAWLDLEPLEAGTAFLER